MFKKILAGIAVFSLCTAISVSGVIYQDLTKQLPTCSSGRFLTNTGTQVVCRVPTSSFNGGNVSTEIDVGTSGVDQSAAFGWGSAAGFGGLGRIGADASVSVYDVTCDVYLMTATTLGGSAAATCGDHLGNFAAHGMVQASMFQAVNSGMNTNATVQVGMFGAPSGSCTSGSLWVRNDGGIGSSLYVCESSVWAAAVSP